MRLPAGPQFLGLPSGRTHANAELLPRDCCNPFPVISGTSAGAINGALIAAAFILYALVEGEDRTLQALPFNALLALMVGGALLYGIVGLAGIALGGNFLDYSVLAEDPVAGQHLGIILIEAGVGMTVTGVLLAIFHAFAARGRF